MIVCMCMFVCACRVLCVSVCRSRIVCLSVSVSRGRIVCARVCVPVSLSCGATCASVRLCRCRWHRWRPSNLDLSSSVSTSVCVCLCVCLCGCVRACACVSPEAGLLVAPAGFAAAGGWPRAVHEHVRRVLVLLLYPRRAFVSHTTMLQLQRACTQTDIPQRSARGVCAWQGGRAALRRIRQARRRRRQSAPRARRRGPGQSLHPPHAPARRSSACRCGPCSRPAARTRRHRTTSGAAPPAHPERALPGPSCCQRRPAREAAAGRARPPRPLTPRARRQPGRRPLGAERSTGTGARSTAPAQTRAPPSPGLRACALAAAGGGPQARPAARSMVCPPCGRPPRGPRGRGPAAVIPAPSCINVPCSSVECRM